MKIVLLISAVVSVTIALPRAKREAYDLPDGADILVGNIKTTFSCFGDGYYADVDNNCQIFHVCHSTEHEDGSSDQRQWSFLCGNQTLFNQLTLTCADPDESIPCPDAPSFYNINDRVNAGDPKLYFLHDEDIQRAEPLIPAFYRARSNHLEVPSNQGGGRPIRG